MRLSHNKFNAPRILTYISVVESDLFQFVVLFPTNGRQKTRVLSKRGPHLHFSPPQGAGEEKGKICEGTGSFCGPRSWRA